MVARDWLDSFKIGLKTIDDDHRHMLGLMRKIKTAGNVRDRDRCVDLIEELVDFSQAHFKREEKLLLEIEYPSASVHKEYHADLLERADVIKEACRAIRSDRDFQECCEAMFGFLIDDVISGDLKIKSFLEERGLTDSN